MVYPVRSVVFRSHSPSLMPSKMMIQMRSTVSVIVLLATLASPSVPGFPSFDAERAYERYLQGGDPEIALDLARAGRSGQLDALGWQKLGLVWLDLERPRAAAVALQRSLDLDASLSRSWIALGYCVRVLANDDLADELRDRGFEAEHDGALDRIELALSTGDLVMAKALVERVLFDCKGDAEELTARFYEIEIALDLDHDPKHIALLWRAASADARITPGWWPARSSEFWERMGSVLAEAHGYAEAANELGDCFELEELRRWSQSFDVPVLSDR